MHNTGKAFRIFRTNILLFRNEKLKAEKEKNDGTSLIH
jgi:hypothetical protein